MIEALSTSIASPTIRHPQLCRLLVGFHQDHTFPLFFSIRKSSQRKPSPDKVKSRESQVQRKKIISRISSQKVRKSMLHTSLMWFFSVFQLWPSTFPRSKVIGHVSISDQNVHVCVHFPATLENDINLDGHKYCKTFARRRRGVQENFANRLCL